MAVVENFVFMDVNSAETGSWFRFSSLITSMTYLTAVSQFFIWRASMCDGC